MKKFSFLTLIIVSTIILLVGSAYVAVQENIPTFSTTTKTITAAEITPEYTVDNINLSSGVVKSTGLKIFYPTAINDPIYFEEKSQQDLFECAKGILHSNRFGHVKPEIIIDMIELKEGQTIADIGAAYGYDTFPFSQVVGKTGKVYSTDINPYVLWYQMQLRTKMAEKYGEKGYYYDNISIILNRTYDLTLPNEILDIAFIKDVHLLFYDPEKKENGLASEINPDEEEQSRIENAIYEENKNFVLSVKKAMKPNATLVVIEGKHGGEIAVTKETFKKLMKKFGFEIVKDYDEVISDYNFYILKKCEV